MSNMTVPETGEIFDGYVPAKVELAHITVGGVAETTADLVLSSAATAQVTLFDVNVPIVITGMWTQVETAFTASVDLAIGDTAGASTFFVEGTIAATTAGSVLVTSSGLTVPMLKAAGEDLLIDCSNAVPEVGLLHVYIQYAVLAD